MLGRSTPARARVVTPSDGAAGPAGAVAEGGTAAVAPGAATLGAAAGVAVVGAPVAAGGAAVEAAAVAVEATTAAEATTATAEAVAAAEPTTEEATGEGDVEPVAGWAGGVPGSTLYEGDGDPRARSDSTSGEGVTNPGGGDRGHRAGGAPGAAVAHHSTKGARGRCRRGRSQRNLKKGNTVSTKYTCLEVYTR